MTGYRLNVSTRTGAELPHDAPSGWGAIVFRLELPLELAPTMNSYAATKARKWAMAKLNKRVDGLIAAAKREWPSWDMGVTRRVEPVMVRGRPAFTRRGKPRTRTVVTGGRKRNVAVVRYSSREPDEQSVDVLGGKLAIDRLVQAGVLRDDSRQWLAREARWFRAPPKQGRVVIEVYELANDSPQCDV